MKQLMVIVVAILISSIAGYWLGIYQSDDSPGASSAANGERAILYYKAPMDPNYRRDRPGKSPMGMDLVPVYADEAGDTDDGTVRISPTVVNTLGVRTARVQRSALAREIDTVGYIGYDESTLRKISTRADGWIERLKITATGDPVKRGQVLFELYSPTLVNAQEEYLAALQSRNTALHSASRDRLLALGIDTSDIERLNKQRTVRQRISIFAPADGVVAHLGVREGAYVTVASDIMSIGSLQDVWLLAEVFERQASWVRAGLLATVTLDALEPGSREGVVDYVYPELDPVTRTITARIRLDNDSNKLKPNMFARAKIFADPIDGALHIPREALIRGASTNRVVRVNDDGSFRSQPVSVGIETGDRVQITAGLSVNDRVVTSGQFLIDSESNIASASGRMDNQQANPSEPGLDDSMTTPMQHEHAPEGTPDDPHAGHDMSGEDLSADEAPAHERGQHE